MSRHLFTPKAAFLATVFCAVPALNSAAVNGQTDCNTNGVNDIDELTPIFEDYVETPNVVFPDNVETTDTITVSAASNGDMDDLNVDLVVTHIFMGDTEYWLENPAAITVSLMDHVGGSSDNADILFDDQAVGPPDGDPLVGTFKPTEPLSTFPLDVAGRDGKWVIHCLDTFSGSGTGVLNQWSLHFRTFGAPDCNSNGVLDACDIAGGTSSDCNSNAVPDDCEADDCNSNDVVDFCDVTDGGSADCNTNGVPDECEYGDCSNPGADWDNGGVDGVDGLANQIGGVAPAQVADNYIGGGADTSIDIMTFSDIEDTVYSWDGTVQIATYENNGSGAPQEAAVGLKLLAGGDISRVQNGTVFGRPRWDYTLDADVNAPGAGTHWVSAMPGSGGGSGQAFWLTSQGDCVMSYCPTRTCAR